MSKKKSINTRSIKYSIIVATIAVSYIIFSHLLVPFFVHDENSIFSGLFPHDGGASDLSIVIVSILLSISSGLVMAHYQGVELISKPRVVDSDSTKPQNILRKKVEPKLELLQRMMSNDEKLLIKEVKSSGEITQDSLRFRLNWSKAKVSAVLSVLDRQGIVQRERSGKTYRVRLDPSLNEKTV